MFFIVTIKILSSLLHQQMLTNMNEEVEHGDLREVFTIRQS